MLSYTTDALLAYHAAQRPYQIAFDDGRRAIDYAALNRLIGGCAAGLQQSGIATGHAVALVLTDRLEFLIAFYAAARLGALVLPLDPNLTAPALSRFLASVSPSLVITETLALDTCREATRQASLSPRIMLCDTLGSDGFDARLCDAECDAALPPSQPALDRPLVCFYTSGSTGQPKRIVLTNGNLAAETMHFVRATALCPNDTILCLAPLNHSYALENAMLAALGAGSALHILPPTAAPWMARLPEVLARARKCLPRIVFAVPFQFEQLAACVDEGTDVWSSVRYFFSSGGFLSHAVFARFQNRFGHPIRSLYGTSEAGTIAAELGSTVDPATVGRPIPGVEVRVLDDVGMPTPQGVRGHLWVRSPALPTGYAEPLEENPFRDGGYWTGDWGALDLHGRLCIDGRANRFVEIAGTKVDPLAVERTLMTHPAIQEVAVFGLPTAHGTVLSVLWVSEDPLLCEQDVLNYCIARLSPFQIPGQFARCTALPRNAAGKVLREALESVFVAASSAPPRPVPVQADSLTEDRVQALLKTLWCQVLGLDNVGVREDFFARGGNSILAIRLVHRAEALGLALTIRDVLECPTLAGLATRLQRPISKYTSSLVHHPAQNPPLHTLRERPFIMAPGQGGDVLPFSMLTRALRPTLPLILLQDPAFLRTDPWVAPSIHSLVARWVEDVLAEAPTAEPYRIGGYSLGSALALAFASQLIERGRQVERVILLDGVCPVGWYDSFDALGWLALLGVFVPGAPTEQALRSMEVGAGINAVSRAMALANGGTLAETRPFVALSLVTAERMARQIRDWKPPSLEVPITLLRTSDSTETVADYRWGVTLGRSIEVVYVPGDHHTVLRFPHVQTLAMYIEGLLEFPR